jgi:hypothetical protein
MPDVTPRQLSTKAESAIVTADDFLLHDSEALTGQEQLKRVPSSVMTGKENSANKQTTGAIDTSTTKYPSNAVVKSFVESTITSAVANLYDDRGNYNASVNTFPAAGGSGASGAVLRGDIWTVSVAGTLGGTAVTPGASVRALIDTPGQTAANWAIAAIATVGNAASSVIILNTIADLRAVSAPSVGVVYRVRGALNVNDYGGGEFLWDTINHTTTKFPDGGIVISLASDPTGATGAFTRQDVMRQVMANWWGVDNTGATNVQPAVQKAVDFAIYNKCLYKNSYDLDAVVFAPGEYRFGSMLQVGYGLIGAQANGISAPQFNTLSILGQTSLMTSFDLFNVRFLSSFTDGAIINVQGGRGNVISGIDFYGVNALNQAAYNLIPTVYGGIPEASFLALGTSTKTNPYSAILFDAYSETAPANAYPPCVYPSEFGTISQGGKAHTSKARVVKSFFGGFVVGINNKASNDNQADFLTVSDCYATKCHTGVAANHSQGRLTRITGCNLAICYYGAASSRWGNGNAASVFIDNTCFDGSTCAFYADQLGWSNQIVLRDCYGEGLAMVAQFIGSGGHHISIENCEFRCFPNTSIPSHIRANSKLRLINSTFSADGRLFTISRSQPTIHHLEITDCAFWHVQTDANAIALGDRITGLLLSCGQPSADGWTNLTFQRNRYSKNNAGLQPCVIPQIYASTSPLVYLTTPVISGNNVTFTMTAPHFFKKPSIGDFYICGDVAVYELTAYNSTTQESTVKLVSWLNGHSNAPLLSDFSGDKFIGIKRPAQYQLIGDLTLSSAVITNLRRLDGSTFPDGALTALIAAGDLFRPVASNTYWNDGSGGCVGSFVDTGTKSITISNSTAKATVTNLLISVGRPEDDAVKGLVRFNPNA